MNTTLTVAFLGLFCMLAELVVDVTVLHQWQRARTESAKVISRSSGGTVGHHEITLVAEHGQEYVRLPPGTSNDLDVLLTALREGTVLIIVGAYGPRHVLLPAGSQVFTAAQTIVMLASELSKDGLSGA